MHDLLGVVNAMEAALVDGVATTLPRKAAVTKASFILGILNRRSHNNAAYRAGSELQPGKRACEVLTGDLVQYGHVEMLRIRFARLRSESDSESIFDEEVDEYDAYRAAENGYLEVIQELLACRIRCGHRVANVAASMGHIDIVRQLRAAGIHRTSDGANGAAGSGHLHVVRDLRAHGIHCTSEVRIMQQRMVIWKSSATFGITASTALHTVPTRQLNGVIWQSFKTYEPTASTVLPAELTAQLEVAF